MRVLQLIDSLRPGGAEKMAVNIANALVPHIEKSFLCCTRLEGMLKDQLIPEVSYIFIGKKSTLDLKRIYQLLKIIKENRIDIIHAHSTSFFTAVILKLYGGNFKLVWHDHYGESDYLEHRNITTLKACSLLFKGIISVNTRLRDWAFKNLYCKNVLEIENFIPEFPEVICSGELAGPKNAFKVICVANLRPQKDYMNLIRAFELVVIKYSKITLHIFGENPRTEYSKSVIETLRASKAKKSIFYYGPKPNIQYLLKQADLGVLSSKSEGLPLALLEYGMAGLPVVVTDVGKCREVVQDFGKVVPAKDPEILAVAIESYIEDENTRKKDSANFQQNVRKHFSRNNFVVILLGFYKTL